MRDEDLLRTGEAIVVISFSQLKAMSSFVRDYYYWFIIQIINGNYDTVVEFIVYQIRLFQTKDAGHGGPIYYHWLVLLLGCFPASFFAIGSFFQKKSYTNPFNTLVLISGLFTLILFSIVQTKIIHYSSFCYFFITYFR